MAAREYKKFQYVYTEGSAAPRLEPVPEKTPEQLRQEALRRRRAIEERQRRERRIVRNNQRRESAMSRGFVMMLVVMIIVVGAFCFALLQKQNTLTAHRESYYALQQQLSDAQRDNDILEHDILTAANLNQVKKSAQKMGMTYPDASQVVYYSVDNSSYQVETGIYAR